MNNDEARELLRAERSRLQELLDDTSAAAHDDRVAAADPGDMTDPAEPLIAEGVDDAVVASLRVRLDALVRAEQRLHAGTFGKSIRSGAPISDERLRADPAAELTVQEAERTP
jgi:DnaK suppressor protein